MIIVGILVVIYASQWPLAIFEVSCVVHTCNTPAYRWKIYKSEDLVVYLLEISLAKNICGVVISHLGSHIMSHSRKLNVLKNFQTVSIFPRNA